MTLPAIWYAHQAIKETQKYLGTLPSNHEFTVEQTNGDSLQCVRDLRDKVKQDPDSKIEDIKRVANQARKFHCGNCGEYAAITFDWLRLQKCPHPIEYAHQRNWQSKVVHAFVIIGRPIGSIIAFPTLWGSGAVIADAWANKVVKPSDYWDEYLDDIGDWVSNTMKPEIVVRYSGND